MSPKKAQPAPPAKNILDDILDAMPAEGRGKPELESIPAGFRVTAVYSDPDGKRYKAQGDWLVMTRRESLAVGHRFATEAEALAFAATAENVE